MEAISKMATTKKITTQPIGRPARLLSMYKQCREVFDENDPRTRVSLGKVEIARQLLRELAQHIEAGKSIKTKEFRDLCGWVLRSCALGYVPKGFTVKPKKTRPSETDQLSKTGTNTSLRLACLVRLFELAGTPRTRAKQLIEWVCGVSESKIQHACGHWGILSEDIPLLFDGAKGKELDQILGRAKQPSADKARITQQQYNYCTKLLGRYLQLTQ